MAHASRAVRRGVIGQSPIAAKVAHLASTGQALADDAGPEPRRLAIGVEMRTGEEHELLDGEYIDQVDLGVVCEQLGSDLSKGSWDLTCEVRGTGVLARKRIEDAERRVLELERVPSHGALLGGGNRAASLEEGRELRGLPRVLPAGGRALQL
jgi:hypothetical protein